MMSGIIRWAATRLILGCLCAVALARAQSLDLPVEAGVDSTVKPGDDFDAYANGEWLRDTRIPQGVGRWGARNEIALATDHQLAVVVTEARSDATQAAERKVAYFYSAYLAEAGIDRKGLTPIRPLLARIGRVHDAADLASYIGGEVGADVGPVNLGVYESAQLFGLSVERGNHGERKRFAYLLQGGLGLPDRNAYLDASPQMRITRENYTRYIARVLQRAGFDHATRRAQAVLALETAIARCHATPDESANDRNADNRWRREDFPRKAPGLAWAALFHAAGLAQQTEVVVWQPAAIQGEAMLLGTRPLSMWRDYFRFHLIDRFAAVLPRAIAQAAFAIHATEASTFPRRQGTRQQRALQATLQSLPDAVGRLYVARYFPPESKARIQEIGANVIVAMRKRIDLTHWMEPATKAQALAKLDALYLGVGYPESWPDDSGLWLAPGEAVGNLLRIATWNYETMLAKLKVPPDPREWVMSPQTVGANSIPFQDAYNFAAALLQAPKFAPAASDATNYGAIGAILGHEVSHFVDRLGAEYDSLGAIHHWWTPADETRFGLLSEPLVRQFSSYHPLPDIAIDGQATLTENLADLSGLAAAFDAYRSSLGDRLNDRGFVRRQDRAFFLGFARAWRVMLRDDALRKQVGTSDHAPERYRIFTVRNLDAWYDAFDVLPGQRLYLDPSARVHIW